MTGFLYFHPSQARPTPQTFADRGLARIFDQPGCTTTGVGKGPSGAPGFLATPVEGTRMQYRADEQVWRKVPGASDVWVGMWRDDPPTPQSLARPTQLAGKSVRLDDGHDWIVPVARLWTEDADGMIDCVPLLPRKLDINDDGEWVVGSVVAAHKRLWDLSAEFIGRICGGEIENDKTIKISMITGELDLAVEALATNYRVGAIELAMIGCLTDQIRFAIANVVLDLPTFIDWFEKKSTQPSTSAGSSGHEESTTESSDNTLQPSQA